MDQQTDVVEFSGETVEGIPVGRLLPTHPFLQPGNAACQMIQRLGVYDEDSEELCHSVIRTFGCYDPGCGILFNSVLEYDMHYNSIHRYSCATCRKHFASPHLLDLHIDETHDSFFAVQAERKPMYCCFVESCSSRFLTVQERQAHCIESHAFPSNFRWITSKNKSKKSKSKKSSKGDQEMVDEQHMEQDNAYPDRKCNEMQVRTKGIVFGHANKKSFNSKSYTKSDWHKRHTSNNISKDKSVLEGSELSCDLMDSLPTEN